MLALVMGLASVSVDTEAAALRINELTDRLAALERRVQQLGTRKPALKAEPRAVVRLSDSVALRARSITSVTCCREGVMIRALAFVVLLGAVTGCENMSSGQKGAVVGAGLGTGVGLVAGGSFGEVVGAGLIGGGLGYIVGNQK